MIHNHEVPSSILGLATDLEAPVAVWLRALFFCAVLVVAITGVNENECGRKRIVRTGLKCDILIISMLLCRPVEA